MTMPIRLKNEDFEFMQDDHEHVHGMDMIDHVDRDEDATTRVVRAWISPDTARRIALIARAHGVNGSSIVGAMLLHGARSWPGQFEQLDREEDEDDPSQIIMQFDKGDV